MVKLKLFWYLNELCSWFHFTQSVFILYSFFFFLFRQGFGGDTFEQTSLTFGKSIPYPPYALTRGIVGNCVCERGKERECMRVHVIWVFAHVLLQRSANSEKTPESQYWEYLKSHFNEHFSAVLTHFLPVSIICDNLTFFCLKS